MPFKHKPRYQTMKARREDQAYNIMRSLRATERRIVETDKGKYLVDGNGRIIEKL
jgi:hypothetical protein